ncbi:MAG: CAP domain-containing protein [Aggregatilineales bacterium]
MNKIFRLSVPALIVCVLLIGTPHASVRSQQTGTTCPEDAALQASQEPDIVALVNKGRTAAGLGTVSINKMLTAAAQRQSNDMASKDFLDHTGSDGSTASQRMTDAGYNWSVAAENILQRNDLSAAGAYDQWWNSPGHKANMMNPDVTEIGVAFACTAQGGKYYYAMVLGAPLGGGNPNAAPIANPTDAPTANPTDQSSGSGGDVQPTPDVATEASS